VFADNVAASAAFAPDRFDGDVHFFAATVDRPAGLLTPADAWRPHVTGTVRERTVPCAHGEMTRQAPLAEIGPAVASALDALDALDEEY